MIDLHLIVGLILALLIGLSLGLIGSGGSILTVPILVYIVGIDPVLATAYSLFIVGSTSAVGSVRNITDKNVDFKIVALFGIPSLLAVFLTRAQLVPYIPETIQLTEQLALSKSKLIMLVFALVMLAASLRMIRKPKTTTASIEPKPIAAVSLMIQGVLIGVISGIVGAGGGFLIIPALVFFAHLSMRKAIGTSLTIIAIQSLIGFMGDVFIQDIQWPLLLSFSGISILGLFIGIYLSKKIVDSKLKSIFGWFVLVMALYILIKELI